MEKTDLLNMNDLKVKITDQVKVSFFNLLPDDKFKELVDTEVKAFFEATSAEFTVAEISTAGYYGRSDRLKLTTPISPFRAIVWNECNKQVVDKIKGMFGENGIYVGNYWGKSGEPVAMLSPILESMLKTQATDLAATFFTSMFAQAFQTVEPKITDEVISRIKQGSY